LIFDFLKEAFNGINQKTIEKSNSLFLDSFVRYIFIPISLIVIIETFREDWMLKG